MTAVRSAQIIRKSKRVSQCLNPGNMRQNTQFDLRIICADQHIPLIGNERLADLAPFLSADGYIL